MGKLAGMTWLELTMPMVPNAGLNRACSWVSVPLECIRGSALDRSYSPKPFTACDSVYTIQQDSVMVCLDPTFPVL